MNLEKYFLVKQKILTKNPYPQTSIGALTKDDLNFDFDFGFTKEDYNKIVEM